MTDTTTSLDLDAIRHRLAEWRNQQEKCYGLPDSEASRAAMERAMDCGEDIPALLAEVDRLRDDIHGKDPIVAAAYALEEMRADPATTAADTRKALDALYEAVEAQRLWDRAVEAGHREQAASPCDCCYIDGHTRRCGRTATTTGDVAPFGDLNLAADCKARITGTASAAEPEYLIWSNHHKAWWGPNGSGYRSNVNDAGRYTLADTRQWLGRGCRCCEVPEVPVPAEQVLRAGMVDLNKAITDATTAAIKAGNANRHYTAREVAR